MTVKNSGCLIFLIDESAAMSSAVADQPNLDLAKSRRDSISTAINRTLSRLGNGPDFPVSIVGYRTDAAGDVDTGSRWGGSFAGRNFVAVSQLKNSPLLVEQRVTTAPDGSEEKFDFPVWYAPETRGKAAQVNAVKHVAALLKAWVATQPSDSVEPIVIHVSASKSADGNPTNAFAELASDCGHGLKPLIFQVQLTNSHILPTTAYPEKRIFVPEGAKELYQRCTALPPEMRDAIKTQGEVLLPQSVGLIYNAKMVNVSRLMRAIESYCGHWNSVSCDVDIDLHGHSAPAPPPTDDAAPSGEISENSVEPSETDIHSDAESPVSEDTVDQESSKSEVPEANSEVPVEPAPTVAESALLLVMFDRASQKAFSGDLKNGPARLQDQLNEILAELVKKADGHVDVAVLSYGINSVGDHQIVSEFGDKLFVADNALSSVMIREDETEQMIVDEVAGLKKVTVQKPVFAEFEPSESSDSSLAFERAGEVVHSWVSHHQPTDLVIVLHMTSAVACNENSQPDFGTSNSLLYHVIATEVPLSSASYPASEDSLPGYDALRTFFRWSSALHLCEEFHQERPSVVQPSARGIVVNAKFDLLVPTIRRTRNA